MKYLLINAVCGIRSTGRICTDIAKELEKEGHTVKIAYGRENAPEQYGKYAVKIGGNADVYPHALFSKVFDVEGTFSKSATRKFLTWAESYNPDVLWLHNIHDHYINTKLLFEWIKGRPEMTVKWTQHDCWAFTGGCFHFTEAGCNQWKTECQHCPENSRKRFFTREKENFQNKKELFSNIKNMEIISVSHWLEERLNQSFLSQYPVTVMYNGIDENIFKPTPSDFRKKYGLEDKFIVLGVASFWGKSKGLDDFCSLAEKLDDRFAVVMVGLSQKQIKQLPPKITAIERTNDAVELASVYTAADLFFNASKEETFGMTTLEAVKCGTDVLVYENTACEEIARQYGGRVVSRGIDNVMSAIEDFYSVKKRKIFI